jgi:uncharacterized protein (TIGR03437 family)
MRKIFLLLVLAALATGWAADLSSFQVVSSANPSIGVAPDSLATIYGSNLSTVTESATLPWPTRLGDISVVLITDSTNKEQNAGLIYVSPTQMNIWVPAGLAPGIATVAFPFTGLPPGVTAALRIGQVNLQKVAPGLISADGSGKGVAAASGISIAIPTTMQYPFDVFTCTSAGCVADPIDVGVDRPVYLTFYGTGIRGASSLANVVVTIGTTQIQPTYAGPQTQIPGLDQVNVPLGLNLRGSGLVNVTVAVDGVASNPVQINIQ